MMDEEGKLGVDRAGGMRQEGFHSNKRLRLQRLANAKEGSLMPVVGKACWEAPDGTKVPVRSPRQHGV